MQALRLCTDRTAHRGNRGVDLLSLLTMALERGEGSASRPRKDAVPIVQEAGWAPGLVWKGAENLAPTGV